MKYLQEPFSLESEQLTGAYNILLLSLRIDSDHMKFMRMYADPTESMAFAKTTDLANSFDAIRSEIVNTPEPVPQYIVIDWLQRTMPLLHETIDLKNLAIQLLQSCKIQLLLPVNIIEHLRREIDFFLGNLDEVTQGTLTKTRDILGLPGPGQQLMCTIPLNLIDKLPIQDAIQANLAWQELWIKHNMEHAELLTITDRAGVERSEMENILSYYKLSFGDLLRDVLAVDMGQYGHITDIQYKSISLGNDWKKYLEIILGAIRTCQLRENFPQRLVEHMIIETNLHIEASMRLQANMSGVPMTRASPDGATFSQITPKSILLG